MMEQDPVTSLLDQLAQERAALDEVAAGHRVAVAAAETVIDAELSAAEVSRTLAAAQLPADLAEKYETLRTHLKGGRCGPTHWQSL